jgi:hypothetical protein
MRWVFNFLTIVCVLLMAVDGWAWIRSLTFADYFFGDFVDGQHRVIGDFRVVSKLGVLLVRDGFLKQGVSINCIPHTTSHLVGPASAEEVIAVTWMESQYESFTSDFAGSWDGQGWVFERQLEDHARSPFIGGGGLIPGTQFSIAIRYWAILGMLSVIPLSWFVEMRIRLARFRVGHCRACGYDLRASPEQCPECGSVVRSF